MKQTKKILFLAIAFFLSSLYGASLNLVVFSYDRPLQLYAFLESFELNTQGCERISVIYKTSTEQFDHGYELVKEQFPQIEFSKQSPQNKTDFKPLTLKAIGFNKEKYCIFAVDDIIVTRPINFDEITETLDIVPSNGFYLRLGSHINECYSENRVTGTPSLNEIFPGILRWHFKDCSGDWGYPHTVDMTVYAKEQLKELFIQMAFTNPNTLEGNWACHGPRHKTGFCYANAAIVNCPLNIVQTTWKNRHSNECSPEELLEMFLQGYKLDIMPLQNIFNRAPHMDYKPTFIAR